MLKSRAGLRFSSIGVGVSGFKVVCKPPQWCAVRGEEMILRMEEGEEEEEDKILEEGIRRDGKRGREREREQGMNVYSTIFSETRGNKKTSTLAGHRETNALTHCVKANTTAFSHTLHFVAAEVRVWSPLYLVLWQDAWSRMTLPSIDYSSRETRTMQLLPNCVAQN